MRPSCRCFRLYPLTMHKDLPVIALNFSTCQKKIFQVKASDRKWQVIEALPTNQIAAQNDGFEAAPAD